MKPEDLLKLLAEVQRARTALVASLLPVEWMDLHSYLVWPAYGEDTLKVAFVEDPSDSEAPQVYVENYDTGEKIYQGPLDFTENLLAGIVR